MEELRFKLSPDGRIGFEVTEKTGGSQGRKVEKSRVEWLVWRLGGKRECMQLVRCRGFSHISLIFPSELVLTPLNRQENGGSASLRSTGRI